MGVSFTGCEQIKSLADVNFDVTFTADLPVTVPGEGQLKSLDEGMAGYRFTESESVNPLSNEDINEYKDKIKGWQNKGVTLTVISVESAPVVVSNVVLTVNNGNAATEAVFEILEPWTINNGSLHTFTDTENISKLIAILNAKKVFTVKIVGDSDTGSITIQFQYAQEVTVTANPL